MKQGKQVDLPETRTCTEKDLWRLDQNLCAFRTVARMLCASQPFSFKDKKEDKSNKKSCLDDIQTLLGDLCDISVFPVWGGRNFVAGKQVAD